MSSIKFEWVHFTGTGNKSGYVVFVKDPSYKLTETEQHQVTATALQTALTFKEDGLAQFYCCKLFTSRATFLYHRMKAHPLPCYNCKDCHHSTCLGCCKICHNHSELIAVLQNFVNKSGKEVNPFLYMTLSDLIQDLITGAPSEVVKCLCHGEFRLTEFKDHLLNIAFHVSLNQNSAVHYPGCCWNIHVNSNPKYDFLNHIINHHHSYEECKKFDQRGCKCDICIDHLDLHLIKRYLIVKDSMLYIDEKSVLDDLVRLSSKDRCCVMCEKKHKTIDKLRTHILAVNLHITPIERNPKQYPKNPPTLKNIILHKHGFLECCQKILKQNKKAVDSKLLKHIMTNHSSKCRLCKMMTNASNDQCCRVCHEHATFYWILQNLAVLVNLKEVLNTETSNMVTYLIEKIHEYITSVSGLAKKNNCPFCNRVYSSWDLLCDHLKKVAFHSKTCCGPGLPRNKFPSCCTSSINKPLLLTHLLSKTHIPFRGTSQCYKQNLFCCIQCRSHEKLRKILNCMVKPMESWKDEINDQPEFYFSSAETLITAMVYQPREDKYDYNCPICNEDLNKANLLYKHLDEAARHFSVCQGISKDVKWYKPCCHSATSRRELLLHIVDSLENHISEGNMSCEICKSHWRFKWLICTLVQKLEDVNRHMFYLTEKRLMVDIIEHACKDNTCPFCNQKFSSLRVLQMHIFLMKKHCFSGCDCEEKEREFLKRKSLLMKEECEPDLHRNETSDDRTKKNVQRVNVKAPADKTVSTKKLPIVQKETRSHCPSEPITKPKTMDKTNANREAPKFKLPAPPVFLTQIPPALPSPQSPYIMYGPQVQCIPMQQYNIINPLQQQRALGQPQLMNLSPQVINPQYLVRTCFVPGISPCQGFVRPGIPARPQVIQVQSPSQTLAVSQPQWSHQVNIPQTATMSQPQLKPAKTSTVTQPQGMHQVCGLSQVPGTSQPQGMQVHRASNVLAVSQPQLIQIRSTSLPPGRSQMMHQVCSPSQTLTASQPQVQSPSQTLTVSQPQPQGMQVHRASNVLAVSQPQLIQIRSTSLPPGRSQMMHQVCSPAQTLTASQPQVQSLSQTLAVSQPQWSHQVNIPQTATMSQPEVKPAKTSTVTQPQGMHQLCGPSQVPGTSQPQGMQVHRPSNVLAVSQPQLIQIRNTSLPPGRSQMMHQVCSPSQTLTASQPQVQSPSQTLTVSQPQAKQSKTSTVTQPQGMHQVCGPSQVPVVKHSQLVKGRSSSQTRETSQPHLMQVHRPSKVSQPQLRQIRSKSLPQYAHQVHIPQTAAMSQAQVKPAKTSTVTQPRLMHQVCGPSLPPIAIQEPLKHQVRSTSQVPGTTPPQLVQVKLTNFVNKSQNKRPRSKNKKNEKNDSDQNSNTMEPPYKIPRYPITNNCSLFQPQKKNVGSCSLFSTESQVTNQTVPDAPAFPRPTQPSRILAITNATPAKTKDTSQFQYNAKKFEVQMSVKNPLLDAEVIITNIVDAKLFYRAAVVAKGSVQCSGCKSFFPTKEILMVHHIFNLGYCNRCSRLYDARLYEIKLDDDDCEMCVKHIGWKWLMLVMVEYDRIYDNVDDLLQAFFTCFRSVCLYCKTRHNSKNAARAHLWIVLTHMKTCQKWKRYIYPNSEIMNVPGNKKSYTAIIHVPENRRSYTGKKLKDISISFNSNAYANIDQREQTVSSTQLPSDTGANQNDLERTEYSNVIVIKPDPDVKLDTGVEPQTDMEVGNERWNQLRTDFQSANEVINVTKTIMKNVLTDFEEYEPTPLAKSISPFDVEIKKDDDFVMVESSPTANKEEPLEIGRNEQDTESFTILLRDAETNAPDVKVEEEIV